MYFMMFLWTTVILIATILTSTPMVTHDDECPHNDTVAPGDYEPAVVVDTNQEKPNQYIDRPQSIHLQWIFITSFAASGLLNDPAGEQP